ncbi:GTP cyclohydrolase II [Pseudoclavibacter sp. CFCC 13796]|nr:GTP cyclohydrolase II [Pseudoclavibacter sp. CFCC 11306]KAB1659868.1 GTP cyclohydrolase II [Pseudoclavibacter sp. CFCC 13796]
MVHLVSSSDRVEFVVETRIPTDYGIFRVRGYRDLVTGADHLAVISEHPLDGEPLVRVHSECLTGEVLGSQKCECGPQLHAALRMIDARGGVVIYLRGHEGRGIGLLEKLRAYRLQEQGLDTVDANRALGHADDEREYGAAVAILGDLGIDHVRLLTNNPLKRTDLEQHGITVTDQVPLVVGETEFNQGYLETKRDRMGHILPADL